MLKPLVFFFIAAAALIFFLNRSAQNGQAQQTSPFAFTGRGIGGGFAASPPGGGASSPSSQTGTSLIHSPGQTPQPVTDTSTGTNAPSALTPAPGASTVTPAPPQGKRQQAPVRVTPSPQMTPAASARLSTVPSAPAGSISPYQDGVYTGNQLVTPEGAMQVQITIRGGSIADLQFLSFPRSGLANLLGSYLVVPLLREEVVAAQGTAIMVPLVSAPVRDAFIASLQSSLDKALPPG